MCSHFEAGDGTFNILYVVPRPAHFDQGSRDAGQWGVLWDRTEVESGQIVDAAGWFSSEVIHNAKQRASNNNARHPWKAEPF